MPGEAKPEKTRTGSKPNGRHGKAKLAAESSVVGAVPACAELPIADLAVEDTTFQFRFATKPDGLVDSLRLVGQRDAIDVMGSRKPFRVVDGFRRIAAAAELGWGTIRANVHSDLSESKAWQLAFTKNVLRKNLSPLERANAVFLARKNGVGTTELADLFGISQRQVERDLNLIDLPEGILAVCDGRVVTVEHARVLHDWSISDPQRWAATIREQKLSARELVRKLKATSQGQRGRMQKFAQVSEDRVRCYSFVLRATADRKEKARAVEALQRVLGWLKADLRD